MTTWPVTVTPSATVAEALDLMQPDVICVEPETDLGDVVELLIEHKIGAVPVVEPDTQAIVGIISYIDVLRAMQATFEEG